MSGNWVARLYNQSELFEGHQQSLPTCTPPFPVWSLLIRVPVSTVTSPDSAVRVIDSRRDPVGILSNREARLLVSRGAAKVVRRKANAIETIEIEAAFLFLFRWPAPSAFSAIAAKERRAILNAQLDDLGSRDALLVRLRYSSELTFVQIGEALGICEDAAFKLHGRVLDRMRNGLAAIGITEIGQI